ncbi:MAG: NAD-binding protein [Candidatus Margulisiibacteriota bacterium]|jgi:alanine dehydrogenase
MVSSLAILRESKTDTQGREIENRVAMLPAQVAQLIERAPQVEIFVESGAGEKIGYRDEQYAEAGAKLCSHTEALDKDIVVGVKETKTADFPRLRNNLFISYQHFAQSFDRTTLALQASREKGTAFLALETMETIKDGCPFFPCLAPMSEAAAKVIARHADEFALLSKKIISSGLPETGLKGLKTVVLGGGRVGQTAAEEFSERGCRVILLEKNPLRVKALADYFKSHDLRFPNVTVLEMSPSNLRNTIKEAFFLVSAIYNAGKKPEKLVTLDLLRTMRAGGCLYPVDIDQGGGIEGVLETSLLEPFNLPTVPGSEVFFFAPPNLPSMGALTASEALGIVLLPYVIEIAQKWLYKAKDDNPIINSGVNIEGGKIVHPGLASVFPGLK